MYGLSAWTVHMLDKNIVVRCTLRSSNCAHTCACMRARMHTCTFTRTSMHYRTGISLWAAENHSSIVPIFRGQGVESSLLHMEHVFFHMAFFVTMWWFVSWPMPASMRPGGEKVLLPRLPPRLGPVVDTNAAGLGSG